MLWAKLTNQVIISSILLLTTAMRKHHRHQKMFLFNKTNDLPSEAHAIHMSLVKELAILSFQAFVVCLGCASRVLKEESNSQTH